MQVSAPDITIGFSTTNKLASKIIRFVTRAPCSHAWLAYYDATLQSRMVMQAEAWGFEVRPWARWIRQNILIAEFRPTVAPLDIVRLGGFLGSRYDYRAAFLVGFFRLIGRGFKGVFKDPRKLMCSEAIIRVLSWARYRAVEGLDPETTSPGRVLDCCLQWDQREFDLIRAQPKISERHQVRRLP